MTSRTVALYSFASQTRQWLPVPAWDTLSDTISAHAARLSFATYNVFSGSASADLPHGRHRARAAMALLERCKADVIALQEVSADFEQSLRRERWLRKDWCLTSLVDYFATAATSQIAQDRGDDGCIMAIRRSLLEAPEAPIVKMCRLPGQQGKVLITVQLPSGISVSTAHFESLAANASIRAQQYRHVSSLLEDSPDAVILADFNHSAYMELSNLLQSAGKQSNTVFMDVTMALPSPEKGTGTAANTASKVDPLRDNPTFGQLYPFFGPSRRKEKGKPRRLDMILVKGNRLRLRDHAIDGHKPVQIDKRDQAVGGKNSDYKNDTTEKVRLRCKQGRGGNCYASDHLAVLASFDLLPLETSNDPVNSA